MVDEKRKQYEKPVVTEIEPLRNFFPADEYHQDYLDKHPDGYCHLPLELFAFAKNAKK
jgi:peptide methionine sulfoxide reductase msrA/msrB